MIENIDKVLDRGDRLELLVDKAATMQGNTLRFRKQARRFRSTVWWRNVKLMYVNTLLQPPPPPFPPTHTHTHVH